MIWENPKLKIEPFKIAGNRISSGPELIKILRKKSDYDLTNFWSKKWKNLKDYMRSYLKGQRVKSPLLGWVLKYPNQKMIEAEENQKINLKKTYRLNRSDKIQNLLDHQGITFYNVLIPNIEPLDIHPKQFSNLLSIAIILINRLPSENWPKNITNLNNLSTKNKASLLVGLSTLVKDQSEKQTTYMGWKWKKTLEFSSTNALKTIEIENVGKQFEKNSIIYHY